MLSPCLAFINVKFEIFRWAINLVSCYEILQLRSAAAGSFPVRKAAVTKPYLVRKLRTSPAILWLLKKQGQLSLAFQIPVQGMQKYQTTVTELKIVAQRVVCNVGVPRIIRVFLWAGNRLLGCDVVWTEDVKRHFRESCCLHPQSAMITGAAGFSETPECICQATQRYIPWHSLQHSHHGERLIWDPFCIGLFRASSW